MKNKIIGLLITTVVIVTINCNSELRAKRGALKAADLSQQREWLKQIALCSCITHGFNNDDSTKHDLSITVLSGLTLYKKNNVRSIIDSAANRLVAKMQPSEIADYGGRKTVMLDCINFYNSRHLD